MAKNRKYQSAAIRFGPALKALLLCALLGGTGVGGQLQPGQVWRLPEPCAPTSAKTTRPFAARQAREARLAGSP